MFLLEVSLCVPADRLESVSLPRRGVGCQRWAFWPKWPHRWKSSPVPPPSVGRQWTCVGALHLCVTAQHKNQVQLQMDELIVEGLWSASTKAKPTKLSSLWRYSQKGWLWPSRWGHHMHYNNKAQKQLTLSSVLGFHEYSATAPWLWGTSMSGCIGGKNPYIKHK